MRGCGNAAAAASAAAAAAAWAAGAATATDDAITGATADAVMVSEVGGGVSVCVLDAWTGLAAMGGLCGL